MNSNRTFSDVVNHPEIKDGTLVSVRVVDKFFEGKVVGKSINGLIDHYIIECIDGTFPNEIYPYKFLSLPVSEIFLKENEIYYKSLTDDELFAIMDQCDDSIHHENMKHLAKIDGEFKERLLTMRSNLKSEPESDLFIRAKVAFQNLKNRGIL